MSIMKDEEGEPCNYKTGKTVIKMKHKVIPEMIPRWIYKDIFSSFRPLSPASGVCPSNQQIGSR